jgi:hypothetical protein
MPVKARNGAAQEQQQQPGSSLSLAAIDDPVELARTMMGMYERDAMFYRRIQDVNRVACRVLLEMSGIKGLVEQEQWAQCLDVSVLCQPFFFTFTNAYCSASAASRSSRWTLKATHPPFGPTRPSSPDFLSLSL